MRWSISSFQHPGRTAALGVVLVAVLLRALDLGLVPELRLRVFDLEQRLWPRVSDPARVVIVDIDEKSLVKYGQWPWPRTRVAELVRRIAEGHPRVLGIDIWGLLGADVFLAPIALLRRAATSWVACRIAC